MIHPAIDHVIGFLAAIVILGAFVGPAVMTFVQFIQRRGRS